MRNVETYQATIPDWATQAEFIVHEPGGNVAPLGDLTILSAPLNAFLVAVASVPNGSVPQFLDCEIELTTPQGYLWSASANTSEEFATGDKRLIVINKASVGLWTVAAKEGVIPYAVTAMAFHPAG